MSTFAFLLLCVQACLVQNVFSQYLGGIGCGCDAGLAGPLGYGRGLGINGLGCDAGLIGPAGYGLGLGLGAPYGAAYGGAGVGDVSVAGEMAVGGTTLVAGQVPILGAVEFGGIVPAGGAVSIAGSCGCGCAGNAFLY
ncbi:chorion class A protein L11-like [Vanessa cardui]|uniref:chorion class A protein L11-like n=1 Tax=Vanessa cardui TaxID=171605 RepID=UPI001F12BBC5|nr:chorion class A protein L11-like [Vanessa cardui]